MMYLVYSQTKIVVVEKENSPFLTLGEYIEAF